MALKLIFMGTPSFAVPILKSINNSKHEILAVYTNPPKKSRRGQRLNESSVHQISKQLKLKVRHPEKLDDEEELKFLKKINPDLVVVVAYGKIIPKNMLNLKNIKFINIHASLLPKWRGAAPIQRSIIAMDGETGISIMKIVPQLDAGPFMLQKKIIIKNDDNYTSLSIKLSKLGSEAILEALHLIENKSLEWINQNEKKVTYAKKILKQESQINWNQPAKQLIAKIRGLNPYPGVWFKHKKVKIKIIDAVEVFVSGNTGEVIDDNLTIACKENSIKVLSLQKEGKKILKVKDFLSGHKLKKGDDLN